MNDLTVALQRCIENKFLIVFTYDGKRRFVEGNEIQMVGSVPDLLLSIEVNSELWKSFKISRMEDIICTDIPCWTLKSTCECCGQKLPTPQRIPL